MNSNTSAKIEDCKQILMKNPLVPLMSIKNIVAGSVYTVLPWSILLIIVAFIILV